MTPVEAAAVLGVPLSASAVVLRARRIQLVKRLHPDVCSGNVSEFVRVQRAFEVLSGFVEEQVRVDGQVSARFSPGAENVPTPNTPEPAQERPVYRANLAESAQLGEVVKPVDSSAIDAIFAAGSQPATPGDPPQSPASTSVSASQTPTGPQPDGDGQSSGLPPNMAVPAASAVGFLIARVIVAPLSHLTVELPVPLTITAAVAVAAVAVIAANTASTRVDLDKVPLPIPAVAAAAGAVLAFADTLVYAAGPIAAVVAVVLAATAPKRTRT